MSVNKVILIGNVTVNPEIRNFNDGKEVANFSIATNEKWKSKDGDTQERVEYHRIVVFSQGLVGIIKGGIQNHWIKKGTKLYIEGQLQTRKWTDSHGVEKYSTKVILQNFNSTLQVLSNVSKDEGNKSTQGSVEGAIKESFGGAVEVENDDIPF